MKTGKCLTFAAALVICTMVTAQDRVNYTGKELSNPAFHDGALSPVIGVHNIQIMRANREKPSRLNGNGWTYNHQPMIAYWNGKFYMHYLSDPSDEHIPPSQTFLMTSADGYKWSNPVTLFPVYRVPEEYTKPGRTDKAHNLDAIMHQRVGFYVSKNNILVVMGNYGVAFDRKDDPNDGNGIGRVVREIKKDGSLGDIFFIYYNHGFNEKNTSFPYYKECHNKNFVKACDEILANPRYRMQWVEEADRNDPIIPLNKVYKAYCDYTLPDGRLVALWKHALTSISSDGGNTWKQPIERAKGFVNSNAKIWGQRLSDGLYATVYNPSEYRWPLALSLSKDGLEYTTLNLVHGEISPMRYGGNYKSCGPQYVRGIQEGNGCPADGDMWVTYSMNKEDIWVSHIPVPIRTEATAQADDDFSKFKNISQLRDWNIYSLQWAPVKLDGKWLVMEDMDLYDYSKIERVIPATDVLKVQFSFMAAQNSNGTLHIEFLDKHGIACSRLEFTPDGVFRVKGGARFGNMMKYIPNKIYNIEAELSVAKRMIIVYVDGKRVGQRIFDAPVHKIERISFRTGQKRIFPTTDTPADWNGILLNAGDEEPLAVYKIANFKTYSSDKKSSSSAILNFSEFRHYVDEFNDMEDENIAQAIPNSMAAQWMEENIPLFECPQKNFEEMFYFRWWTLRKHIKNTPVGYGMTEFLVNRSYADKYNLIACAIGHHIYESRWLRNSKYLNGIIHTWYRGNGGKPMDKMMNFSSWNAYAILGKYKVDGNREFLIDMMDDLKAEYERWEKSHRLENGLYWQRDVQDGMEESISGARNKRYARPTINSYMYGNAQALAFIGMMTGNEGMVMKYGAKADSIKSLVQDKLWNRNHNFFETLKVDSSANVREAIGYIPWYFNLPDNMKFDSAWRQIADENGFDASYGLTTAERRHPEFRTRGVGKCEWDGAIWPFASAQTLTALANYMNNYSSPIITDSIYFNQMEKYVESQYHRGRPYIGEYLDEVTGYWLKGEQERSRYYNHSTFNDLLITGLIGLRPGFGNIVKVNPLVPENKWDWFCLDNILYHGKNITIIWDKYGDKYRIGKGFIILVDGKKIAQNKKLAAVTFDLCNVKTPIKTVGLEETPITGAILKNIHIDDARDRSVSRNCNGINEKPLSTVLDEISRRFDVRLKYDVDTVGKILPYADFRIRPYSLEESLVNVLSPFDFKFVKQNDKLYKIKPYEYARRTPCDGKKLLSYLSSLYAGRNAWESRSEVLKKEVRERLGIDGLLAKCVSSPNVKLSRERKYNGYKVQNFALETLKGKYVCGSIYSSVESGKKPVIICPNGHFNKGRYREDQQQRMGTLARMGAICVDYDLIGWGESAEEHNTPAAHVMQALNGIKILDYMLESREEIDKTRIGVNGGSGGGTQCVLLTTIDSRYTASAPVVSLSSYFDGGCKCESGLPIQLAAGGTCNAELAATFAPRPLLVVSDGGDWTADVPVLEYPFLKRIYGFYNSQNRVENVHLAKEKHDFGPSKRNAVYDFFGRVFNLNLNNIDESKVTIESEDAMKSFVKQ